jgi:hypothetical protein
VTIHQTLENYVRNSTKKRVVAVLLIGIPVVLAYLHWPSINRYPPRSTLGDPLLSDGFEEEENEESGGDPCDHPLVMPVGWTMVAKSWAQCFTPKDGSPVPTYPNSNGFPIPLGALKGEYKICTFVAKPNTTTNMFWDSAQANPGQGYGVARPADSMYIAISTCRGDFRSPPGCSLTAASGTLITSTIHGSSQFYCSLTAGVTYHLTVAPVDPRDGLTPGEHTCRDVPSSANECDVQTRQVGSTAGGSR